MGLCASTEVDKEQQEAEERAKIEAAQQRRRLSVAPNHVGDITKEEKKREAAAASAAASAGGAATGASAGSSAAAAAGGASEEAETEAKTRDEGKYAIRSQTGYVPYNRNKVNQDRAVVKFAVGGFAEATLYAVMDGHGENGHEVAEFVKRDLPQSLGKQKNLVSDPEAAIYAATKMTADNLKRQNINVAFSGTTLVYALRIRADGKDTLYVANVGDSRCVLAQSTGETIGLSNDQKPDNPEEKKRILKAGGRVEPLPGPPGEDCGPERVWLAEVDVPGLAMSRSLGDEVSHSVGVIDVPEIIKHEVNQDVDEFIVLASDGVWEFIDNDEGCKIVWPLLPDLEAAATELVKQSTGKWRDEEEVIDDITCCIVTL